MPPQTQRPGGPPQLPGNRRGVQPPDQPAQPTIEQLQDQNADLQQALQDAQGVIAQQGAILDGLSEPPLFYATVVSTLEAVQAMRPPQVGDKVTITKPGDRNFGRVGTVNGINQTNGQAMIQFDGGPNDFDWYNPPADQIQTVQNLTNLDDPGPFGFHRGDRVRAVAYDPRWPQNITIGTEGRVARAVQPNGDIFVEFDGDDDLRECFAGAETDFELYQSVYKRALIYLEGKFQEVAYLDDLELAPGQMVKVNEKMIIVDLAGTPPAVGAIVTVRRVINAQVSEIETGGNIQVVMHGSLPEPEVGDRVILDSSGIIMMANLGKNDERYQLAAATNVSWDDVGGLEQAKRDVIEAIELPYKNPGIYTFYGKKPVKGLLLFGPPGCGKTLLAKAVATAVASMNGNQVTDTSFIYIKGPEILDKWVGNSEANIRSIFQRARDHKRDHGYPAVVFIDEADAILARRDSGISSDMGRTIVPMFLAEMDGLEESGAIVLLSTNRPDILDSAVTRDGRIDRKIRITRPGVGEMCDIMRIHMAHVPLAEDTEENRTAMVEAAAQAVFDPAKVIYEVTLGGEHAGQTLRFTLGHLASGAMAANLVDQATSFAIRRDLASGQPPQGLTVQDLLDAVDSTFKQIFDLDHKDDLTDFVHDYRKDVVEVKKLRAGAGGA